MYMVGLISIFKESVKHKLSISAASWAVCQVIFFICYSCIVVSDIAYRCLNISAQKK